MTLIHANNFSTNLDGAISNSDTSFDLISVTGFPSVGAGVTCNITVQDGSTIEIMSVTARSSNTITVTRAQEGTSAASFPDLALVEIRATAASFDTKQDLIGGTSYSDVGTPASGDLILLQDVSDSSKLKVAQFSTFGGGGGGGGLVKLSAVSASGTSVVFGSTYLTSTYDNYLFVISGIIGSTQALNMEVSYNNGGAWKSGAGGYNQSIIYMMSNATTVSGFAASNNDEFDLTGQMTSNSGSLPVSGRLNIFELGSAQPLLEWKITQMGSGGYVRTLNGSGTFYDGTSPPINAVRFIYSSGASFSGGIITLYGYEK